MLLLLIRDLYSIPEHLVKEALDYSQASKAYTSDRHDFHPGGLSGKQKKMFEGKLGEKIFKMYLIENNINYAEDVSSHEEADEYDFLLPNEMKIDIKTRTQDFHIRTLEMVEQYKRRPKDIYISVRLYPGNNTGSIIGWFSSKDMLKINKIENHGYLDNYVMYDRDLKPIESLYESILINFVEPKS